jgi:hypothetical protein
VNRADYARDTMDVIWMWKNIQHKLFQEFTIRKVNVNKTHAMGDSVLCNSPNLNSMRKENQVT